MEHHEDESDDAPRSLSDKAYSEFKPAAIPAAPDGGIPPGFAQITQSSQPAPTEDNFICFRGPCRHLWHLVASTGDGNAEGTWQALGIPEPRQHYLTCLVQPGRETELSHDELIHDCSRWDPIDPAERAAREDRRELYWIRRRAQREPVETVEDVVDELEQLGVDKVEDDIDGQPERDVSVILSKERARAWFETGGGDGVKFEALWDEYERSRREGDQ